MKVLIPNSFPLDVDFDADFVEYDIKQPIPDEHVDAEVLVAWGNSKRQLEQCAAQLHRVRLVQTLMAGADAVVAAGFRDEAVICSGIGLHDTTVSEHAIALTLALVRKIPLMIDAKQQHRWEWGMSGRQLLHTKPVTTLQDARVLIWGFGSIAKHLAPMFTSLGAEVTGAARSAGERAGYRVVAEDQLDEALPETDVLIMILPETPATTAALNAEKLAQLPEHAYVVNVGRGRTVDEDALLDALREGGIAGAAIDVMVVEPLPEDSPLWDAPNLIITPHAAGGRPVGASELVSQQLRALDSGTLRNVTSR